MFLEAASHSMDLCLRATPAGPPQLLPAHYLAGCVSMSARAEGGRRLPPLPRIDVKPEYIFMRTIY